MTSSTQPTAVLCASEGLWTSFLTIAPALKSALPLASVPFMRKSRWVPNQQMSKRKFESDFADKSPKHMSHFEAADRSLKIKKGEWM